MAPSKIRRALGHVKDQTSISLAKVGGSTSLSDLDVAIIKATSHEEYPAEERHIREILSLTSYSHVYISACVNTLSRRLNKTKNWTVALKTLMLIQRLLSEGDPACEQEIFFSTRRGTRILNMSDFLDTSQSNSWDYSAFVRTYALYLDERLEYKMEVKSGKRSIYGYDELKDEENDKAIVVRSTPVCEMKTEHVFSRLQSLQQLLERFLARRPTGSAKCNRIVIVALHPIVKESFQIYYDITEILGILIDRFMELDVSKSVKIYEIFCCEAKQFDELENFYSWCKSVGIARSSEYPEIEKITQKKLDLIDELIRDKTALAEGELNQDEPKDESEQEVKEPEPSEEDMNAIKALPAPEDFSEAPVEEDTEKEEEEDNSKAIIVQQEGDLLNLGDDAMSSQDYTDKLALALFDGGAPAGPPPGRGWESFKDAADWESALVQSASNLTNQRATLGGGFDLLLLDGMYQQGQTMIAMASSGYAATGSASSVAFGSAGGPATLALPAPPSSEGKNMGSKGGDPFAASLAVPPPSYVQMSDMVQKQKYLVEEKAMWEQYKRDGIQGHVGMSKLQTYPYNQGWYTHGY
ncbi:putative clathrin assembly protein At1g03050 [Durio zibethinus]|uniref:Clathrin assembly protein At1g03050 n=1 Tax=Durio zibethinus TaxID=66656 RepID=A0A6P5XHC9_DURZI|nr:putative clathrin assembly protein At1g03050 [Durio zibethinus]